MHWEEKFRTLAEQQEGLVANFHLPQLGCTSKHWHRAIRTGRWDLLSGRVLRLRGARGSDAQRAQAGVFDAGPSGFLHGPSTLAWFGLRGFDLGDVHVARPREVQGPPVELGVLHRLRDLRPHHVIEVRGVRTETALRAIWAEAERYAPERLFEVGLARIGRLLDDAHNLHLVTWAALHEMVDDLEERGRSGTVIMRELAAKRLPGSSPAESRNEDRLEKVLVEAGSSPLARQPVVGGHEPIGRSDFRDPELPLVVEVNSLAFHTSPSDRTADRARYRAMNDAGFAVAVVWEDDLWSRPTAVVATIEKGRRHARAGEAVVLHSPGCPWPSEDSAGDRPPVIPSIVSAPGFWGRSSPTGGNQRYPEAG